MNRIGNLILEKVNVNGVVSEIIWVEAGSILERTVNAWTDPDGPYHYLHYKVEHLKTALELFAAHAVKESNGMDVLEKHVKPAFHFVYKGDLDWVVRDYIPFVEDMARLAGVEFHKAVELCALYLKQHHFILS